MTYFDDIMEQLRKKRFQLNLDLPSRTVTKELVEETMNAMFPVSNRLSRSSCGDEALLLHIDYLLKKLLLPIKNELKIPISEICSHYIHALPDVIEALLKDAKAIENFDPAAHCIGEVIISYPGFMAISVYRLAHLLYQKEVPFVPRIMSEYAHSKTGIDINPGATIGENFFIDHGTGVVIGETAVIKNNVKIYQGVTLGALQVKKSLRKTKRHPTVEDDVIIYSGATILGGNTVIGKGSIIGGNVWLTSSIAPKSLVYHSNETKVRSTIKNKNVIDFQI